jgi:membrane protein
VSPAFPLAVLGSVDPYGVTKEVAVPDWLNRLKERPWVAHLLRAVERFTSRLGSQFGAAVTYFSILALVPILLFAFAIAGFLLTVARPELLPQVVNALSGALGGLDAATRQSLVDLAAETLSNWRGVGLVALASAIYSGAGWMGNLKNAVRAQWRRDFDLQEPQGNVVVKIVVNLITLLGLIVLIVITFGLAAVSTALTDTVLGLLGLTEVAWLRPVLQFAPILFSIGAGWLLFMYLYTVLPEDRPQWSVVRRGALMGAIGLGLLQYLTSFLFSIFGNNPAAAIFGPVIALMLFFNIFAQLILFVAAWIATADQPAVPQAEERIRFAVTPEQPDPAEQQEPVMIPEKVAVRSVRVGLGAGYVTGAATGVGLGAVIAFLAARLGRR